jgi:1-acyl-sn-glycerol-3-phosphate acyltransferase
MLYNILRFLSWIILKVFFHLEVFGRENIPKKGGFILASNHTSYLDPIAVGVASPRKLSYMARSDLFKDRLFGWLLTNINVFPVERESADLSALKEAMKRVKRGNGLLLFTEGTRQTENFLTRAYAGIGFLAVKLDVPVVPVFVKGTLQAWPKHAKSIKRSKISVYFGSQIPIERRMPYQDIAQDILSHIRHLSC